MKYKVLKHKELKNTYGTVRKMMGAHALWQHSIPELFPEKTTMQSLVSSAMSFYPHIVLELENYNLITVEIVEV